MELSFGMQTIEQALDKLEQSEFRKSFHLKENDRIYIQEKGMDVIRDHAYAFISSRIAPKSISNDGKQTPVKGHPVFIAQHATACCCRKCLNKWYHVPMGVSLSAQQQGKIVNLLMAWIERQLKANKEEEV